MLKTDTLLYNTEFSKEFPSEYKKLMGESLTKNLVKLLKDAMNLGKYIDYAHERCISNLKTLIKYNWKCNKCNKVTMKIKTTCTVKERKKPSYIN